ncbi:hypothetical protein [Streptococcus oricebi]|nr:hypothetical protein [Streptococcus oricebi]
MTIQSNLGSAGLHASAIKGGLAQVVGAGQVTADTVSLHAASDLALNLIN